VAMRALVPGQEPLQVVKTKLTRRTWPRRSLRRTVLLFWLVSSNAGAGRITASFEECSPQRHRDTEKRRKRIPNFISLLSVFCLLCVSVSLWFNLFFLSTGACHAHGPGRS